MKRMLAVWLLVGVWWSASCWGIEARLTPGEAAVAAAGWAMNMTGVTAHAQSNP